MKKFKLTLLIPSFFIIACSGNSTSVGPNPELPAVAEARHQTPPQATPAQELPETRTPDQGMPEASQGKSYFFSFIRANPNDPSGMMDFGVSQTSQVNESISKLSTIPFELDTELDPLAMSSSILQGKFSDLRTKLKQEDTVVLYTHSHGLIPGLGLNWNAPSRAEIPFSWQSLAQEIISLPAKNVIIFTMACHSGYLTEALNALSSQWKNKRSSAGRNLIVLTAVAKEQLASATDRGTTETSIGNPFTYAVKTAFQGFADGFDGQPKDGKTTLQELVGYVLATAKSKSTDSYAEPQFAGEYVSSDVMFP